MCHNAFWFQGRPYAPDRPGGAVPEILARLVQVYRRLEPDVLCLQEIQSEGVFQGLREQMEMPGAYCPGGALPQYGGAVLWREGELLSDWRGGDDPPERMWQIVEAPFAGGVVRVANVHLPSSRHLGEERAAGRRLEEMETVASHGPAPDMIVGDFNEQPGGPLGKLLAAHGYEDAAVLAGRTHIGTTPGNRRNDQIWVIQRFWDSVADYGATPNDEMVADVPGKEHLSDHFPVWIELNAETKT